MPFPSNWFIIDKWRAFKGKFPPGSDKEHRIIIVYKNEGKINYFYVTSKVDSARKIAKNDIGSLVTGINSSDWKELDKESCIQCDKKHLNETSETELRQQYKKESLKNIGEVPDKIKQLIISAISKSTSYTANEKKKYTV